MTQFSTRAQARSDADLEATVQGNTEFALALYRELRSNKGNLFFSPHSISTALAMTYAGARGRTAAQMAGALCFRLNPDALHPAFAQLEAALAEAERSGEIQLKVANSLWPHENYRFLPEFLALVREHYGALVTALDYGDPEAARQAINAWVEERTERKILDLVPDGLLDTLTRLVLVNAIYFKGNWATPFDPDDTREAPFWVEPGIPVQVPMMAITRQLRYGQAEGVQVLELPYAGHELSMVVLLPQESGGLAALEERLTVDALAEWTAGLWSTQVQVSLPRFEITFPFRLDGALQALGMVDAYGDASDFSGMDGSKNLFLAAVLHKAFVAVNEEGTEAAAATAVVMALRSMAIAPPVVFCADHPFLFLIRHNSTGSLLFLGRVANPAGT